MAEVVDVKSKSSIKPKLIIGGIVLFVVLLIVANVQTKNKEKKAAEEAQKKLDAMSASSVVVEDNSEELSDAELEQQALIEVFGEPPAGFRWDEDGNPVPISDESLTAEEVGYQFLRAVSTLNMETAQKYAYNSRVLSMFDSYYDLDASESYYTQFSRQLYQEALLSLEIENLENTVVFADGRRIFTFEVSVLDLSYKDWWLDNKDEIFKNLKAYLTTEGDSVKAQQYIYEQVLAYFSSEGAARKTTKVDIVLDKVTLGGWVITDDTSLAMLCEYTDGTTVYEYIMEEYDNWATEQYQ